MKLVPIPKRVKTSANTQTLSEVRIQSAFISPSADLERLRNHLQTMFPNVQRLTFPPLPVSTNDDEQNMMFIIFPLSNSGTSHTEQPPYLRLRNDDVGHFDTEILDEGYRILKDPQEIRIFASSERGMFYGLQTVKQLLSHDMVPAQVMIEDWPDHPIRGIHLDLKGLIPRFEYMLQLVETLAAYKINTIVMEYEDKIPWPGHPLLEDTHAWSYKELQIFLQHCKNHYIEVIPLQQTFGHLHYILKFEEYSHLRETADYPSEICPINEEAVELITDRLEQVIQLHPDSKYVHIGCDETLYLNTCAKCQEHFGSNGKFDNYIQHVNRMAEIVVRRGKIPIIWDDMLRNMSDSDIARVHPQITIMVWSYYHQDLIQLQLESHLDRYQRLGIPMIGAGCCFGADSHTGNLPNFRVRQENLLGWGNRAQNYSLRGLVSTTWAKYSSIDAYCELMPVIPYPALLSAAISWSGTGCAQAHVDEGILFQYWGIDNTPSGFQFSRINYGHYEANLYGDLYWLHHLAESTTKHVEEAKFLHLMARLNRLLTVSEHTFERLYLLTKATSQPIEKKLVRTYIESLAEQIGSFEEEAIQLLARFYTEDQVRDWVCSRLFNSKWMIDTTLKRWSEVFDPNDPGVSVN
jgi:hypothetical protein